MAGRTDPRSLVVLQAAGKKISSCVTQWHWDRWLLFDTSANRVIGSNGWNLDHLVYLIAREHFGWGASPTPLTYNVKNWRVMCLHVTAHTSLHDLHYMIFIKIFNIESQYLDMAIKTHRCSWDARDWVIYYGSLKDCQLNASCYKNPLRTLTNSDFF